MQSSPHPVRPTTSHYDPQPVALCKVCICCHEHYTALCDRADDKVLAAQGFGSQMDSKGKLSLGQNIRALSVLLIQIVVLRNGLI
jgi:hypothetical protein